MAEQIISGRPPQKGGEVGLSENITLEVSDLQIGAVELKDGDSDTRADIELDSAKNSLYVQSESLATAANQSTIIGHVDGIEGLLTTIDADTSTLAAAFPAAAQITADDQAAPTTTSVYSYLMGYDSAGDNWDRITASSLGQATMSSSFPVVIASNQSTLNVAETGFATAITIYHQDITAGTDHSYTIPSNTRKITLRLVDANGKASLQRVYYSFDIANVTDPTNTTAWNILDGEVKTEDLLNFTGKILYFGVPSGETELNTEKLIIESLQIA